MTDAHHPLKLVIETIGPDASADIRSLAEPEIEAARFRSAPRAAIDAVTSGADPESRGLVAMHEGRVAGFIVYGTIAGSEGTGRLQLIVADSRSRRRGIASALVDAAIIDMQSGGARFAIVEVPDDPSLAPALRLLERCGFRPDARVADFFRDGVDLLILRRDIAGS